jgi:hypothetical protein
VPEGLVEFIPEMGSLIKNINSLMPKISATEPEEIRKLVIEGLTDQSR